MRTTQKTKAFTIIELLVVVSIIALLLGILLPAIGKARDQAFVTRSQGNLRQLAIAHATYGSEWNDNQWTTAPHNLAAYGDELNEAVTNYLKSIPGSKSLQLHPDTSKVALHVGWAQKGGVVADHWWAHKAGNQVTHAAALPIDFDTSDRWGSFRMINARSFNTYLSGRFYDPTLYAPKDRMVITAIADCWEAPGEFCALSKGGPHGSSYILSPAAMFAPSVFEAKTVSMQAIFDNPGSLRTPAFSQARYPDLKTHMLEHHWLQRARHDCNPAYPAIGPNAGPYEGCQPYFFNGGRDSVPATLFYDGHVSMLGVREVMQANGQAIANCTQSDKSLCSLWHTNTPLGQGAQGGYFHNKVYNQPGGSMPYAANAVSYHILTRDGIRGRDRLSR